MTVQSAELGDAVIASRHRPILMLDSREPYEPLFLGYTVFREPGLSPSSKFEVVPAEATCIEYAIWYDWDIGHLFDLEHVWVHLGADGAVTAVDASVHGRRQRMRLIHGLPELRSGRPVLYPEPGKHAHWVDPVQIDPQTRQRLAVVCGPLAGHEGVQLGNHFAQSGAFKVMPADHRLARLRMRQHAFVPSFDFTRPSEPELLAWPELADRIPRRIATILAELPNTEPHLKAVFFDCGDTLVDERTEVKAPGSEVVLSGELIPGARQMLDALKEHGHRIVLVADGPRKSFVNLLGQHQLWEHFDGHIISEDVGALKPDPAMFDAALETVGLTRADARHVVMVGNNLERDIRGANALGITSVLMAWSSLRPRHAASAAAHPDYRILTPGELPTLIDIIESSLRYKEPAFLSPTQQAT
jgi:FMN phosphatase YigB (HAD superfamily)